jgi:hypothetical protein
MNNPLMYTDPSGYRREPPHYISDYESPSSLSDGRDKRNSFSWNTFIYILFYNSKIK